MKHFSKTFCSSTIALIVFWCSFASFASADDIRLTECTEQGWTEGAHRAALFCGVLEAQYQNRHPRFSDAVPVRLCELEIAQQCRNAMQATLDQRSLCGTLVRQDWNGASTRWQASVDAACVAPQIVACPFPNADVQAYVWCRDPASGRHYGNNQGVWWQFVDNRADGQGNRTFLIRGDDGAVRIIYPGELELVHTW